MKRFLLLGLIFLPLISISQKLPSVKIIQDSIPCSFRGLSVPSDNVVWVSGSNGTVGRSTDGGPTWKWMIVPGFEKRDFRDIEALDSLSAMIMAVDNPANILKTNDGGKSWKVVFHEEQEGMFLDAIDVYKNKAVCIGDPIDRGDIKNWVFIAKKVDTTDTWNQDQSPIVTIPLIEAIFAGSGTNIFLMDHKKYEYAFITGVRSRLYLIGKENSITHHDLPFLEGNTAGAFSFWTNRKDQFYITGGDYSAYWKDSGNVVYTTNAGKTWKRSSTHGYRSCIIQSAQKTFITCGTNGVDISFDGCKTFQLIHGDGAKGKDGFNVCAKSKTGKAVYFAGTGRVGKLI